MGKEKYGAGVQLLHSWLMIRRIIIKLRLTGKSRLISNSTSSSAEVVTELYEILELSLS